MAGPGHQRSPLQGPSDIDHTQQDPETTRQAQVSQEGGWLGKVGPPSLIEGRKLREKTPSGGAARGTPLEPQRSCSKRWLWRLLPIAPIWLPNCSARGAICLLVPPPTPSPDVHASSTEAPQTPNTKSCPKCCWGPRRDQV